MRSSSATTARKGVVSLERALSKLGLASRTEARALIRAGRVAVDGTMLTDPGAAVVPERATIAIDDAVRARPVPITILLHKPRGVVTTRSDPQGRATVYGLLTGVAAHVVPVGRLDFATSGLLLLTNDTRLADWLTDPRSGVPRVYLVTVKRRVEPETVATLEQGVASHGDLLAAQSVSVRKASSRESHLVMTLTEGKNREVRRLLAAVGHPVTRLRRVQYGGLELGTLPAGQWRLVTPEELAQAFPGRPQRWTPRRLIPSKLHSKRLPL